MKRLRPYLARLLVLMVFLLPLPLGAAQISEIAGLEQTLGEALLRFLSLEDLGVRYALGGALTMGLGCGLMGSFLVARRLALVGDTLSHAVLPGVVGGFLWAQGRNPLSIFVGAVIAGLMGMGALYWLQKRLKVREDSALGIVLSGFFAVGIVMLTKVQRMNIAGKAGLDRFLFGQAAAILPEDLELMAAVTALAWVLVLIFYRPLVAISFDGHFARCIGLPVRFLEGIFMGALASVVVVSLKAGGVVLVAALLITPAATAQLITRRFSHLLALSVVFSVMSTTLGALCSALIAAMPTGPCMVGIAGLMFLCALLFAPKSGLIAKWIRALQFRRRTEKENTLKALFHLIENHGFNTPEFTLSACAHQLHTTAEHAKKALLPLIRDEGVLELAQSGLFRMTQEGWQAACLVVRKHRMWELYLERAVDFSADHVHEDAERVEHILDPQLLSALEDRLGHPTRDPHGKLIPDTHTPLPRAPHLHEHPL